jgi:hypothetical protein
MVGFFEALIILIHAFIGSDDFPDLQTGACLALRPVTPSANIIPGQRRILMASISRSLVMEEKSQPDSLAIRSISTTVSCGILRLF